MPSLSIERMRAADLSDVLAIERVSFSMPWSRDAFLYEMEQNQVARCWVGRDDGRVVGYICLWEVADELHIMVKGRIVYAASPERFRAEEAQIRTRYLTV